MTAAGRDAAAPRGRTAFVVLLALLSSVALACSALGAWQLQRLAWKRDLIARVEARVEAAPVPAPGRADWPAVSAARDEYRVVRLDGAFLAGDTRVQALTASGPGVWILTPFRTLAGEVVLVNRGFVPTGGRADAPPSVAAVTGLLRLPEPGGRLLRRNEPAADRWYSRDTAAIAAARGLGPVAPFFVDLTGFVPSAANAGTAPDGGIVRPDRSAWPRTGLTVLRFRNHHLGYALTWFGLALLSAGAAVFVVRDARRAAGTGPRHANDRHL